MDKTFKVDKHFSIDSDDSGRTTLVTQSGDTLILSADVASALCDHLINALAVTITLRPMGRYTTKVGR